ncbi:MAG TPA: carboxypeptidase regulatory-like domain-containing protein [Thermoanaerobaculia bacterium]|nr:carboxypeptidase regulatory-like domain-containing protein [Thermoanaerobaculia bacterium]
MSVPGQPLLSTAVRSARKTLSLALFAMITTVPMFAQVTTGTLAGTVVTRGDNAALPGVTVEATHVPTGTVYSTVSGGNGRYTIANVRVGGPYTVRTTLEGFRPQTETGIQVGLGTPAEVPVSMVLSALSEAITVTASADDIINPNRTGSSSAVSVEQIESLPTVNRSLQDFARTNPYFSVDPSDASATRVNVAGRNNRYNSIQIDGAVNNDLFGLSDTGTPGGGTDTQPISLDAIQQLQLVVSPYDVRQGGFTGGGINAVTRSGTNDFTGSLFGTKRDQQFVGDGPLDRPIANFDSDQYGGRIGGRIFKDRLFFFLSGEINTRQQPTGVSVDGSTGTRFNNPADATRLRDLLISKYAYDPGSLGDFAGETKSDLAFLRFDWNVNATNQLTLRHNYVDAIRDVISDRSTTRYRFDTSIYNTADETNSSVAQLNSVFGPATFNEARISLQTIRDKRTTPVIFPTVEIGGTGPRNGALNIGTERFSGANELDQDVLEFTDDFTLVRGNHSITVGTHNEVFEFKNLFLSEFYGYYYFPTVAAFESGTATEYRISFANGADPRRPTQFKAAQYGLYVSDLWRVSNNLSLTMGIRGDKPSYPDQPSFNAAVQDRIGFNTSNTGSEDIVYSPRIGFNWQPGGTGTQQLRGGVGIFAGRAPYVWISNVYGNTGIESTALSCTGSSCVRPAFNPNPLAQPRNLGSGGTVSVDLIDPDFTFPNVLRGTLGYDRNLFWGIRGTAEVVYSETQDDVFYTNVNRKQTGTSPLDGRPTFERVNTQLDNAVQLSNTSEGSELISSLQLTRPFSNGLTLSASYSHQDAQSALDATSSRAISNFQFRPTAGDIFLQDVARSQFEVRDRGTISTSYAFPTGPLGHTLALYYNVQSGRPYSVMIAGDPNRDGFSTNDLFFAPKAADSIILRNCPVTTSGPACAGSTAIPYATLGAFLTSLGLDPTEGRILDRNEFTEPTNRQLDFHYALELPVLRFGTEISFDVTNVLNLIDKENGKVRFVSNQTYTPVTYLGQDTASGKPIYREAFAGALNPGRQFNIADQRSRWQARLGLRVNF